MSIFSVFVNAVAKGGISALPAALLTATEQTAAWAAQLTPTGPNSIEGQITAGVVQDVNLAVTAASEWANTPIAPTLANFSEEVASLVTKYGPIILGAAQAASAPGATLLSALTDVGSAVLAHEVLALQGSSASPQAVTAAAPAA